MVTRLGYIEGYYGKLLDNAGRRVIADSFQLEAGLGETASDRFWFYAPKEDLKHRRRWRLSYDAKELEQFATFADYATKRGIAWVPGVAPGLDWQGDEDLKPLIDKVEALLNAGANTVALLFDDLPPESIDADIGALHLRLCQQVQSHLSSEAELWLVPSHYCLSFAGGSLSASDYLRELAGNLDQTVVWWTGARVVPERVEKDEITELANHLGSEIALWDNFYANDYQPHRCVLGAPTGRDSGVPELKYWGINPTGAPQLDAMLMATCVGVIQGLSSAEAWRGAARQAGLPAEAIDLLAQLTPLKEPDWEQLAPSAEQIDILRQLVFDWHGALHIEMYPWMHGLWRRCVKAGKTKAK